MNNAQRILVRTVGLICLVIGVVGFVRPFKTYEEGSQYQVTAYSRRTGRTLDQRIQSGSDLQNDQRVGAVIMLRIGSFASGLHDHRRVDYAAIKFTREANT